MASGIDGAAPNIAPSMAAKSFHGDQNIQTTTDYFQGGIVTPDV